MANKTVIILGSRSQSHVSFGYSAGKQCTGMCIGFSVYTEKRDMLSLKSKDIDNVLDLGNHVYEACSSHYEVEILAGDELPTEICYDGVRYKLARGHMRYGFLDDFRNLTFQLTNVFCTYTQTLFICKGYTVLVKYSNGHYFLFDSHKKDSSGRKHANGRASVMRFQNFSEMIQYISRLFHSENREQYDIVPIQINQELAKSGMSPAIRCFFRRKRVTCVRQYESDVMPISSDDNSVDMSSGTEQNCSTFTQYRKRKRPRVVDIHYESEMEEAKRLKENVSTCVLGPGNKVVFVDDDCPDMSDTFQSSENENSDSRGGNVSRNSKNRRSLRLKKIGNGWCVVKDSQNPVLRQRDKSQIEIIKSSLSFSHGTVVLLVKENGVWRLESPASVGPKPSGIQSLPKRVLKTMSFGLRNVLPSSKSKVSKKKYLENTCENGPESSCNSDKENLEPCLSFSHLESEVPTTEVHSKNPDDLRIRRPRNKKPSEDNPTVAKNTRTPNVQDSNSNVEFVPSKLLSMTSSAIRSRKLRAKKRESLETSSQNVVTINIQDSNSDVEVVPTKPLSMTPSAIRNRKLRAKKRESMETSCQNVVTINVQDSNSDVDVVPTKTLSMTPSAIRNRKLRAKKRESMETSCQNVVTVNNQDSNSDLELVPTKPLSMTPSAIRNRKLRAKKHEYMETPCEKVVTISIEDTNADVDVAPTKPLSMTSSAIRMRKNRAEKHAEKEFLVNLSNGVSEVQGFPTDIDQKTREPLSLLSQPSNLCIPDDLFFSKSLSMSQSAIRARKYRDKKRAEMAISSKESEFEKSATTNVSNSNFPDTSTQTFNHLSFNSDKENNYPCRDMNRTILDSDIREIPQRSKNAEKCKSYRSRKKYKNVDLQSTISESRVLDENIFQDSIPNTSNDNVPRTLSMTPNAIRIRERVQLNKINPSDIGDVPSKSQSMTPTAIRLRNFRAQKRTERLYDLSTSEDENPVVNISENHGTNVCTPSRNYRISRRKRPLYDAPVFQNNDWSVNTHYGNPCLSNSVPANDIMNNDFALEVPDSTFVVSETINDDPFNTGVQDSDCDDVDGDVPAVNVPLIDFHLDDEEILVENNSSVVDIPLSKITKLTESVDHVCVFCTKLCFPEQGKYYCGIYLQKYRIYLDPNYSENRAFICGTCNRQIKMNKSPTFNKHHGIYWPPKIPDLDILPHEERLIALRLPFMHIQILPSGGQRSLKGNVINVPADINETIFMLPRHINDQGTVTVKLKRRLCYRAVYQDSNVRPVKVLEALKYLKLNSTYYQQSPIQVSETWLTETIQHIENTGNMQLNNDEFDSENEISIPAYVLNESSDQNVSNPQGSGNEGDNECEPPESDDHFSEVDRSDVPAIHDTMLDIIPRNTVLNVAPGEGQVPLHMLYDKTGEEMAFPTIYCGKAIDEIFPSNFKFLQRTRWELTTEDRRVAQRTELIFYKYKMYQLDFIKQQGRLALRFLKQDKQYTAKDLRTDEQRNEIKLVDDGFFFYRKLRNSPQYLQQKKRELFATIRQLGIPTFFVSLSAADTKWPELLQSLGKIVDGRLYTLDDINAMSFTDKTRLVNSDPVTCARYFDRRFQFFLKHIIYKSPHPLGPITDHFYRIEFQHRGSPHVHMILFSESAPKYNKDEDNVRVIEYIDKYISCSLEPRVEANPYINYQVHKHSKTCRKGGRPTCRFHYPLPPFEKTVILRKNPNKEPHQKEKYLEIQKYLDSDAITDDTTLTDILEHFSLTYEEYEIIVRSSLTRDQVFLKRKPKECRVNMYIKNLLHIWQANMDCQFCLDPYSVVSYIVNYINKENRGLSLNLATVTRQCESEKRSIRETIKRLGNVFLNTSEICVQECVYVLMGMALTHQSVDVQLLNTSVVEKRIKVVKNHTEMTDISDDSTDIYRDSLYDIYTKRPLYFIDWTFSDYISIVRITPRTAKSKDKELEGVHVSRYNNRYYLDANKKYSIGKRRILSFMCPPKSQNEEEYFRIHLLLFHPWLNEPNTNDNYPTYKSMYLELSQCEKDDLHENAKIYTKQNLQTLQELYENLSNDVSNVVVAPGLDQRNLEDIELGVESLCGGTFFRPRQTDPTDIDFDNLEPGVNTEQETVGTLWPPEQLCKSVINLNEGQRHIFDFIMSEVISGKNTLRLFITGGAGAGKTFLLHTINQALSRYYNLQPLQIPSINSVIKAASTGKAAFLIRGETIHGALGIRPKNCYEFYERLTADKLNTMQVKFRGTKVLMLDEISMVGLNFFRFINTRLQDIMANDEPFGGLHILCFGDLFQLPPVNDKWIFDYNDRGLSSLEFNLWVHYFQMYELTEIMRQREERDFAELLNRMRIGKLNNSDFSELNKRVIPTDVCDDGLVCLHLFSTNKAAEDYNMICFNKCNSEKEQIVAVDTIVDVVSPDVKILVIAALNKQNVFGGVARSLDLAVGLTYETTQNINVQDGLFNGTSGILKFIQYMDGYEKPVALWFQFEEPLIGQTQRRIYSHYRTLEISRLWTPIFAITRDFRLKDPKVSIRRKQFPVHQSTGKTIHRAQGCTVPEICIQLSDFTHRNGFYVACSRVPKIQNLHIVNFAPNQILTDKKVGLEMERLRCESTLNIEIDIFPSKDKWFSIYYCNIQSLLLHIDYLRSDIHVSKCNIMLLNETHLTNEDCDSLIEIEGFDSYRFDAEVTNSGRRPYNGLILYLRSYFDVYISCKFRTERFEYMFCEIGTDWDKVLVVLVYVKPQSSHVDLISLFDHIFRNPMVNYREINIIGDFNFNAVVPDNLRFLLSITERYNLIINETSVTTNRNTRIDLCFSSRITPVSCHFVPWSYHKALLYQF